MRHFTKLMGFTTVVLAVAVAGENSARGQFDQANGTDLFAERNGTGMTCLDMTDPCGLDIAINKVDSADDTVWVRLREADALTRFSEGFTANNSFTLATFVRDSGPADGAVSVEGDVTLSGATVTVAMGTALRLESDDVTLTGSSAGTDGEIWLGEGSRQLALRLPAGTETDDECGAAAFGSLTIIGDVKVMDGGQDCDPKNHMAIMHSLTVKSGVLLNMGNLRLAIDAAPTYTNKAGEFERGSVVVEEDGSIVGKEHFVLRPDAMGPSIDRAYTTTPEDCYKVMGEGTIEMDILKEKDSGVCIALAEIGDGGMNTNRGGALYLTGTSRIDGSFRNAGKARTEFWKVEVLNEDLEVWGVDPMDAANRATHVGTAMLFPPNFCDSRRGGRSRAGGVYVYAPIDILGGVFLYGTKVFEPGSSTYTECKEGLYFMGDSEPNNDDNTWSPAGDRPLLTSTIFGPFVAKGSSHVVLDDWNFYHNLAFEDDFEVSSGISFDIVTGATYRYNKDNVAGTPIPANVCGFGSAVRELRGGKIIFQGDLDQDILYPNINLTSPSVQINKSPNSKLTISKEGGIFKAKVLEIRSGILVTNGKLSMDIANEAMVLHTNGKVDKGEGEIAYTSHDTKPGYMVYTGTGSQTTSDEIYPPYESGDQTLIFATTWLQVFKPDAATLTFGRSIYISNYFDLHSGKVEVAGDYQFILQKNALLEIGSQSDFVDGSSNVFINKGDDYNPRNSGLRLEYLGDDNRRAGNIWPGTSELPGSDYIKSVTINGGRQCGDDAYPVVTLDGEYSRMNQNFFLTRGALDLNGNHLVMFAEAASEDQRLSINATARLCDSAAGVSCSTGEMAAHVGSEHHEEVGAKSAKLVGADFAARDFAITGANVEAILSSGGSVERAVTSASVEVGIVDTKVEIVDAVVRGLEAIGRGNAPYEELNLLRHNQKVLRSIRMDAAKAANGGGMLYFVGNGDTRLSVATIGKRIMLPSTIVMRRMPLPADAEPDATPRTGRVLLSGTGTAPEDGNNGLLNLDELTFPSVAIEHGKLELNSTVDVVHVASSLVQNEGSFLFSSMAADLSSSLEGAQTQTLRIGSDATAGSHVQLAGEFNANGGEVHVYGDFTLGKEDGASTVFDLDGGTHMVVGDFYVGPDAEDGITRYIHGSPCKDVQSTRSGKTTVTGDYYFAGTGDCHDDARYSADEQGLSGSVTFAGGETQTIIHTADPDAQFSSVILHSVSDDPSAAFNFGGPVVQNVFGMLSLRRGVLHLGASNSWTMRNSGLEPNLAGRVAADAGSGTVTLGSRYSYVNGPFTRTVAIGNAGGQAVTGGYLFPVGTATTDTTADGDLDSFRPLTLQFPADLVSASIATVAYRSDISADDMAWPEDGLQVDAYGGGTLSLDTVGDQFWMIRFDNVPAHDPNIRVAADELPNVFDARGLRLVQWNCDTSNPRLAGVYDLESDRTGEDDNAFVVNDQINGVLHLTQEGVDVQECNIIGIASNFLQNPISLPPQIGRLAKVQYIQNVAEMPIDVYVDGNRIGNDWGFQTATQFANLVRGEHTIEVVAAADADNSNPMVSETVRFGPERNYDVVIHGDAGQIAVKVVDDVRTQTKIENNVEFFTVHGARELGPVDIRLLNPFNDSEVIGLLANNFTWGESSSYISLAPGWYNVEIRTADNVSQIDVFELDLLNFGQEAFVLNLSGSGMSSIEGISLLGVKQDGSTFFPPVVTSAEASDNIPARFGLQGNYPNPFNPSTRIQVDLPESAEVTIQVMDLLGRRIMTLPAQDLEAGAKRSVEIDAAGLASGTYLYRVIAKSASGTNRGVGRMVLLK